MSTSQFDRRFLARDNDINVDLQARFKASQLPKRRTQRPVRASLMGSYGSSNPHKRLQPAPSVRPLGSNPIRQLSRPGSRPISKPGSPLRAEFHDDSILRLEELERRERELAIRERELQLREMERREMEFMEREKRLDFSFENEGGKERERIDTFETEARKAEEARKVEEAKRAEEARRAEFIQAEEARRAEQALQAEDLRRAVEEAEKEKAEAARRAKKAERREKRRLQREAELRAIKEAEMRAIERERLAKEAREKELRERELRERELREKELRERELRERELREAREREAREISAKAYVNEVTPPISSRLQRERERRLAVSKDKPNEALSAFSASSIPDSSAPSAPSVPSASFAALASPATTSSPSAPSPPTNALLSLNFSELPISNSEIQRRYEARKIAELASRAEAEQKRLEELQKSSTAQKRSSKSKKRTSKSKKVKIPSSPKPEMTRSRSKRQIRREEADNVRRQFETGARPALGHVDSLCSTPSVVESRRPKVQPPKEEDEWEDVEEIVMLKGAQGVDMKRSKSLKSIFGVFKRTKQEALEPVEPVEPVKPLPKSESIKLKPEIPGKPKKKLKKGLKGNKNKYKAQFQEEEEEEEDLFTFENNGLQLCAETEDSPGFQRPGFDQFDAALFTQKDHEYTYEDFKRDSVYLVGQRSSKSSSKRVSMNSRGGLISPETPFEFNTEGFDYLHSVIEVNSKDIASVPSLASSETELTCSEKQSPLTKYSSLSLHLKSAMRKGSSANSNTVSFSNKVHVSKTWSKSLYDRQLDEANTCTYLTPLIIEDIKVELNDFKRTMLVHRESLKNTHYFVV